MKLQTDWSPTNMALWVWKIGQFVTSMCGTQMSCTYHVTYGYHNHCNSKVAKYWVTTLVWHPYYANVLLERFMQCMMGDTWVNCASLPQNVLQAPWHTFWISIEKTVTHLQQPNNLLSKRATLFLKCISCKVKEERDGLLLTGPSSWGQF